MLALEREYKTFKYKTYPAETYYVASTSNVRQMLLDMDTFFRLCLDLPPASGEAIAADIATGPASIPTTSPNREQVCAFPFCS